MPLSHPTVLAFERKLDPSDALFYAGDWNDKDCHKQWRPISLQEKNVRGTISHFLGNNNPEEVEKEVQKSNPQRVDVAMLPADADTLKVAFTLRVLPGTGTPSTCNNLAYREKLEKIVADWHKQPEHGFIDLARRYAYNLANGRFLWRNRIGAEKIEIHIERLLEGKAENKWVFDDVLSFSLRKFEFKEPAVKNLEELAQVLHSGLKGPKHVLLQVTAFVRIGAGQEVFPSQEFIQSDDKNKVDHKSKTLYHVNKIAAFHSQKIGNAIRTIDTWYPENEGISIADLGPIPIEPYGSVTVQGKAYRAPNNGSKDFYNLLDNWVLRDQDLNLDDQNYVIAVLIRGGVFGKKGGN
ncbi:MAG: type I-F CRISPR-associated protein Csy3 [Azoarcus sp.]|jgi:CRISPR-associated protein Csy3|nr:type I-F CRISPR-associated protein Csy3 [Azoarcus sp.]